MSYKIKVTNKKIDLNKIIPHYNKKTGASIIFLGTIKNINKEKKVKGIFYTIFKKLFITILKKKCIYLQKKYKNIQINITQYYGFLNIGEINLVVMVSSESRKPAFYICKDIVETIKYNVPIWKKEIYKDNTVSW